jgi:carbonic anhydrase/acetyltransferase-like protein (isoleucine patch superfamily)
VLHEVVVGEEAIVGANAMVPNRKQIPPLARALGVPVTITEHAVQPGWFALGVQSYVDRSARYRQELRRLD